MFFRKNELMSKTFHGKIKDINKKGKYNVF